MDSNYHSMRRPEDEGDQGDVARRERERNGASSSSNTYDASQTKLHHHSPYSPTNGTHPRPHQFTNSYHPTTPGALSMPTPTHPLASPRSLTAPTAAYQVDLLPAPREKPKSNYYDPTSDSGPLESTGWGEAQNHTPQVINSGCGYESRVIKVNC